MNEEYKVNTGSNGMFKSTITIRQGHGGEIRHSKPSKLTFGKFQGSAFTLVELMVVVAVIGVIAGIVLAAAGGVQKKAARDQAKAEIKTLSIALERYRADKGEYPQATATSQTALIANLTNYMTFKTNQISGLGTNAQLLDPYGYPYRYRCPARATTNMMGSSYEIWSPGPNGRSDYDQVQPLGTNSFDDITSWQ